MLWHLLKSLPVSSKKKLAECTSLRSNLSERSTAETNAIASEVEAHAPESELSVANAQDLFKEEVARKVAQLRHRVPTSRIEVPLEETITPAVLKQQTETQRNAMAYWRKDTRSERPTDSGFYQALTETGSLRGSTAEGTVLAVKQLRASQTLSKLSSMQADTSKNQLLGKYAEKNQPEVESRKIDALPTLPRETTSILRAKIENYPHYRGGWEPEKLAPDNRYSDSDVSSNAIHVVDLDIDQDLDLDVALHPDLDVDPDADLAGNFPAPASKWTLPQDTSDELVQALNAIESSPQCDSLFEESAQSERASLAYAEAQARAQAEARANQCTTLDSLPQEQMIEVRMAISDHPETSLDVLRTLARDTNPDVRFCLAENHNIDQEILRFLSNDENPYIAHRARKTLRRLENGELKPGNFRQTICVSKRQEAN